MLRNIKYIWNGMSYKELKQTIIEGRKVRAFPLVDNPSKSTPLVHLLPCHFHCHVARSRVDRISVHSSPSGGT